MSNIPIIKLRDYELSFRERDNLMFICGNPEYISGRRFYSVIDFFSNIVAIKLKGKDRILIIKGIYGVYNISEGLVPVYKIRYDEKVENGDEVLGEMI